LPLFFFSRWSGVTVASSDQLNVASVCKAKGDSDRPGEFG
jgi:hypothetical protein